MRPLRLSIAFGIVLLLLSITETNAHAAQIISIDSAQSLQNAKVMLARMDEINAIDKSLVAKSEVKALRKELRMIKGELKELDKGTYITVRKVSILLLLPLIAFSIID